MYLSQITLQNFRSYLQKTFDFSPKVNLILGPNGSGKTNILESIYFLASGKSFRASSSSQLISWDQKFLTTQGHIVNGDRQFDLETRLVYSPITSHLTRHFLIDGVGKLRRQYLGQLRLVVFEPEDIRLITGSPTRRRGFLDSVFLSSEWRYASALSQYHRALRHRNELLDLIKLNRSSKNELFYWDQSLVKNSQIIHRYRNSLIVHVNHFFSHHPHPEIKLLSLDYRQSLLLPQRLEENYFSDLDRGYTQAGPHRDDFSLDNSAFSAVDKNLAFWGSRGQQRLATLGLRLAQIDYLETTYHHPPVLLLDDIFSELDPEHRELVVKICAKYQTIFTSTEKGTIGLLPHGQVLELPAAQS